MNDKTQLTERKDAALTQRGSTSSTPTRPTAALDAMYAAGMARSR